jgi:hypothetical protein
MKVLYLDESGDHSLTRIDPQYPVFVLGGVIIDRTYAQRVVDRELRALKRRFFGNDELIIHTADIVRARNGFETLADQEKRQAFLSALNGLMASLEYQVLACVIKKDEHLAEHGADAQDPYMMGLNVLIERFCYEIGNQADGGLIYVEKRGAELDNALESAWTNILLRHGTHHVGGNVIHKRIVDLAPKDKRLNVAGLQLADLVVSPIGRAIIGKQTNEDWENVKSKFRRGPSGYEGFGLIVLPKGRG